MAEEEEEEEEELQAPLREVWGEDAAPALAPAVSAWEVASLAGT